MGTPLLKYSCACCFVFFLGCASSLPVHSSPDLSNRAPSIKRIVMVPPKVEVYELGVSSREKIDEWSLQAESTLVNILKSQFAQRPVLELRAWPQDSLAPARKADLEESQALFDAVNNSVVTHTYGEGGTIFADKIKKFEYSLGPETGGLSDSADAFLFVRAVDNISSGGRKAAQAGAAIVGALFGMAVRTPGGITSISLALVDAKDGTLLWHTYTAEEGKYDLRDPDSTNDLVTKAMEKFPLPPKM